MSTIRFTKDHDYVRLEGETATIGITGYAQEQLGDIVFVELPAVGTSFKKGDEIAIVESVKAASEIYAPVSGTIVEVNDALTGDPGLVNTDAQKDGWLVKLTVTGTNEFDGLMDEAAYAGHTS